MSQVAAPVVQVGLVAAPGTPPSWRAGWPGSSARNSPRRTRRCTGRSGQPAVAAGGRLSRALTAAIAAGVLALITSDIWRLADGSGWPRLTVIAVGSVVAVVVTLVVGAQLWERPRFRRVRKQVLLFNVATTATVVIDVLTLYAVLFLIALAGSLLLVVAPLFAEGLGHPAALSDYLEPAWPTCSLATVGGALGAGLESDDAVREADHTYRSEQPVH